MPKMKETFYDTLKITPQATISEIVNAYHSAKNAFSKDSLATYSLFSAEDIQAELSKVEEAYLTLSNLEKRIDYDKWLRVQGGIEAGVTPDIPAPAPTREAEPSPEKVTGPDEDSLSENLKQIRMKKGLSLDDVSRITKIPMKFLKYIEDETFQKLPARVYVQGFVKNLATLYRLDPQKMCKIYLVKFDEKVKPD